MLYSSSEVIFILAIPDPTNTLSLLYWKECNSTTVKRSAELLLLTRMQFVVTRLKSPIAFLAWATCRSRQSCSIGRDSTAKTEMAGDWAEEWQGSKIFVSTENTQSQERTRFCHSAETRIKALSSLPSTLLSQHWEQTREIYIGPPLSTNSLRARPKGDLTF